MTMLNSHTVDMVASYCAADLEAYDELPFHVREYVRSMIAPPRSAVILQSVYVAGARATLEALREHDMRERIRGTH
jgi:hypothetical protein